MSRRNELLDHLIDQLTPLGDARGRAMFGGWGVYLDGLIVGLIAFDTFYLKVDAGNRPDFEAAGSSPFSYDTGSGTNVMNGYWEVPADVLDDSDDLRAWTLKSLAASRRASQRKRRPSATGRSPARPTASRQQSKVHHKGTKDTKKKRRNHR